MAKYRKGYKVDPETGLTAPEARAGLTREQAEAEEAGEAQPQANATAPAQTESPASAGSTARPRRIVMTKPQLAFVIGIVVLGLVGIIVAAVSGGGGDNKPAAAKAANSPQPPPPPPASSGPKKASNGDDAADLHNRAQQAVNRAEVCLAAVYLASQDKTNVNSMALSLQKARSVCNEARSYLASNDAHGFTDQNTELFGAADEAKSATNAGLAYLDTQYPSKLADFTNHVQSASSFFKQGLTDLNARLSELGVAHAKQ